MAAEPSSGPQPARRLVAVFGATADGSPHGRSPRPPARCDSSGGSTSFRRLPTDLGRPSAAQAPASRRCPRREPSAVRRRPRRRAMTTCHRYPNLGASRPSRLSLPRRRSRPIRVRSRGLCSGRRPRSNPVRNRPRRSRTTWPRCPRRPARAREACPVPADATTPPTAEPVPAPDGPPAGLDQAPTPDPAPPTGAGAAARSTARAESVALDRSGSRDDRARRARACVLVRRGADLGR